MDYAEEAAVAETTGFDADAQAIMRNYDEDETEFAETVDDAQVAFDEAKEEELSAKCEEELPAKRHRVATGALPKRRPLPLVPKASLLGQSWPFPPPMPPASSRQAPALPGQSWQFPPSAPPLTSSPAHVRLFGNAEQLAKKADELQRSANAAAEEAAQATAAAKVLSDSLAGSRSADDDDDNNMYDERDQLYCCVLLLLLP